MHMTISKNQFMDAFRNAGRKDQFSYNALSALYDYLEEIDPDYNLDVIELCCAYTEYASLEDFQDEYGEDYDTLEKIERDTTVIPVDGDGFIIGDF